MRRSRQLAIHKEGGAFSNQDDHKEIRNWEIRENRVGIRDIGNVIRRGVRTRVARVLTRDSSQKRFDRNGIMTLQFEN